MPSSPNSPAFKWALDRLGHGVPCVVGQYRPDIRAFACWIFTAQNVQAETASSFNKGVAQAHGLASMAAIEFRELVEWNPASPTTQAFVETLSELKELEEWFTRSVTGQQPVVESPTPQPTSAAASGEAVETPTVTANESVPVQNVFDPADRDKDGVVTPKERRKFDRQQ